MNITVVGAGAWGTALGVVLSQNGHAVTVWGHNADHLAAAAAERENRRYLPGVPLPADWAFEPDLARAAAGADGLLLAVPSKALRATVERLAGFAGFADVRHQAVIGDQADTGLGSAPADTGGCDQTLLDGLIEESPAQAGVRADGADLGHPDPLRAEGAAIVCRQAGGVRCVVHEGKLVPSRPTRTGHGVR